MQKDEDGKHHPVQYASRKLTKAEAKYSTFELEALAVVFGLKNFRNYLLGAPFTVFSDQKALWEAFTKRDAHGLLTRWLNLLAEFEFHMEHVKGKVNVVADFLSRE